VITEKKSGSTSTSTDPRLADSVAETPTVMSTAFYCHGHHASDSYLPQKYYHSCSDPRSGCANCLSNNGFITIPQVWKHCLDGWYSIPYGHDDNNSLTSKDQDKDLDNLKNDLLKQRHDDMPQPPGLELAYHVLG
jgi:hypothetical protein